MRDTKDHLTPDSGGETSESRAPGRNRRKQTRPVAMPGRIDTLSEAREFVAALGDVERGRILQAALELTSGRTTVARLFAACSHRPGLAAMLADTLDHWVGA